MKQPQRTFIIQLYLPDGSPTKPAEGATNVYTNTGTLTFTTREGTTHQTSLPYFITETTAASVDAAS